MGRGAFYIIFVPHLLTPGYLSHEGEGNGFFGDIPVNSDGAEKISGLFGPIADSDSLRLARMYFLPVVLSGSAVARGGDAFEPECLRAGVAQADGLLFRAVGRHCA